MAEMETLADQVWDALDAAHGNARHVHAAECCWSFPNAGDNAADAALSWLASVLADDATVRTVAEALEDATIQHLGRDLGTAHRDEIAAHALAALSAHLTASARAGDTSGEEAGRG